MSRTILEYRTKTVCPTPGPRWEIRGPGGELAVMQEGRFLIGSERRRGYFNQDCSLHR